MAEKRDRRPRNEPDERDLIEEDATDTGEDDEQFEDVDTEDEDLDEDVIDEEASGQDHHFTAEIGSEGGSTGDLEERRAQSGIVRGSEATETGRPSSDAWETRDRRAGRP
jgi:hypothetical protein